jgi:hypothetical protein
VLAKIHFASLRPRGASLVRHAHPYDRWGPPPGQQPQAVRCCGRLPWRRMRRFPSQTRVPLLNLGDQYDDSATSQRQVSSGRRRGVAAKAGISWGGSRRWYRSQLGATPRLQTKRCATACLKQLTAQSKARPVIARLSSNDGSVSSGTDGRTESR